MFKKLEGVPGKHCLHMCCTPGVSGELGKLCKTYSITLNSVRQVLCSLGLSADELYKISCYASVTEWYAGYQEDLAHARTVCTRHLL